MTPRISLAAALAMIAAAALAHEGVKDPQVKARMDAMEEIAAATKVLGQMARGATAFDAEEAHGAAASIAARAAEVPALFEAQADDPTSEALPAIWQNFGDFTAKAGAMEQAARAATAISSPADLGPALSALGTTCKDCHGPYRE